MEDIKIAIVIVLYNEMPPNYVYDRQDYQIVIVDNTKQRKLNISGDNINYIPLLKNYGIAYALNVGFRKAKELGANWVLTMDQDSELPDNMIEKYSKVICSVKNEKIGLLSPIINIYEGQDNHISNSIEVTDYALTSGSLVNIKAYEEIGGFKNELFIDCVDFEFCLNLRTHGYKIVKVGSVLMQHHLGNTKEYKLFGKHLFYITNHSYIRSYYVMRNSLYVHDLYPLYFPKKSFFQICISIIKIILFENDAIRKIKAIMLGIKDYKNNVKGVFQYNL